MSIKVVGLDVGNITTVATCKDKVSIIESRLELANAFDLETNVNTIEVDGELFAVERGNFENETVKHKKDNYLKLMWYTLAQVTDEGDLINLCLSIPSSQFNTKHKQELEQLIEENKEKTIKVNGTVRNIKINKFHVVPESYSVKAIGGFKGCSKGAEIIVFDIGGGTSDIGFFDEQQRFIDGKSIDTALLDLYADTKEELRNYNVTTTIEDAKKYFDGDKVLRDEQFQEVKGYKGNVYKKFFIKLFNQFKGLVKNANQCNIVLCGGGSNKVYSNFKKVYPQTLIVEGVDITAKGNERIGVYKWQRN